MTKFSYVYEITYRTQCGGKGVFCTTSSRENFTPAYAQSVLDGSLYRGCVVSEVKQVSKKERKS